MRLAWFLLPLLAQLPGTNSKPELKAEWMGRSLLNDQGNVTLPNHIAVDVTIAPSLQEALDVATGDFQLRINGRKQILSDTPGAVAASLKYPDWQSSPNLQAEAGPVILGRPTPTERFPGDPSARRPRPPRAPEPDDRSGVDKTPPKTPAELVIAAALPEGITHKPQHGFVYFPYRGKLANLKTIELLYKGTVLSLK